MVPTHVFGFGAREYAEAKGWSGVTIYEGSTLNAQQGASGKSPESRRHIVVTPGTYTGVDFYLGERPFVTLEGAIEERPKFIGDKISVGKSRELSVLNLELVNCGVAIVSYREDGPALSVFEDLYQHSFVNAGNGFVNPHGLTKFEQDAVWRRCVLDGTGDQGNTKHSIYWESRPLSVLTFEDGAIYGARACSQIKTTCRTLNIRRTHLTTKSMIDPGVTAGTMVDVPACSLLVMSDCTLDLWRNPVATPSKLDNGLATPAVFLRDRQKGIKGCDIPAYPDVSWDPPVSKIATASSPGGGWSASPATYTSDQFWAEVQAAHEQGYESPFAFPAFISGTTFRCPPDSKPVPAIRNDGTRACEEVFQFGPTRMLRTHPNWHERSIVVACMNTHEGNIPPPVLDDEANITEAEQGACHPRTQPYHYPRYVEIAPEMIPSIPSWFPR